MSDIKNLFKYVKNLKLNIDNNYSNINNSKFYKNLKNIYDNLNDINVKIVEKHDLKKFMTKMKIFTIYYLKNYKN